MHLNGSINIFVNSGMHLSNEFLIVTFLKRKIEQHCHLASRTKVLQKSREFQRIVYNSLELHLQCLFYIE